MIDYARRRTMMVDTQVRPSDVTKFPIIDAMLDVPREVFVPRNLREAAYLGENLEVSRGRVMLDPRILAKMLDAVNVGNDDLVMDIGSCFGYSAAVIAHMAAAVVAVEEDGEMIGEAQELLSDIGADNVILHEGPLAGGAAAHGPYDVITLQGATSRLPAGLADQLKEGGRMACLFMDGNLGVMRIGYKIDGHMNWRDAFNGWAPVLPGFEDQPEFVL